MVSSAHKKKEKKESTQTVQVIVPHDGTREKSRQFTACHLGFISDGDNCVKPSSKVTSMKEILPTIDVVTLQFG